MTLSSGAVASMVFLLVIKVFRVLPTHLLIGAINIRFLNSGDRKINKMQLTQP